MDGIISDPNPTTYYSSEDVVINSYSYGFNLNVYPHDGKRETALQIMRDAIEDIKTVSKRVIMIK